MSVGLNWWIFFFAAVNLIAVSSVQGIDWVARHGLTGTEYQAEYDKWSDQGLSLCSIAGYNDAVNDGDVRYAAVWDNADHSPQRTGHGMTKSALNSQSNTNLEQGYRLKFINMYNVGTEIRYAAIWEPSNQTETHLLELTGNEFESTHKVLTGLGYQLISMSSCNLIDRGESQDLYSGVWVQADPFDLGNELRFRLTANEYQAEFNDLAGQGYRLICLVPCEVNGELRYNSIWKGPESSSWWSYHNLGEADYDAENENALYQHLRTEYVSVHVLDGEPRFNAVWADNGGMPSDCIKILKDGIQQFMENNDTPGISIAIMKDGRLIFARGYGRSDHVTGQHAAPLDRYRIASISKPITAAAILQVMEDTDLGLDDLVFGIGDTALGVQYGNGRYSDWEKQITVRHLLNHTSGWTRDDPLWNNTYGQDHDAIMDWSLDQNSPSSAPGSSYTYNNLNYHALARVIEKYTGQGYENYCRNNFLAHCGISTMELGKQSLEDRKEREVRYYDSQNDPYTIIDPERMDANGGWIATAVDLLLFLRHIDDRPFPSDLLKAASLNAMRTGSEPKANWGLGWTWNTSRSWEGHNGCMTGTSSFLVDRDDGIAYAVLANKRTSCSWSLKNTIDGLIDQLNAKDQWPSHDLFPFRASYKEWIDLNFSEALSTFSGTGFFNLICPDGDSDEDDLVNLTEKYFGTDPNFSDPQPLSVQRNEEGLILRWPNPQGTGYIAKVLLSEDFQVWEEGNYVPVRSVDDLGIPIGFMEVPIPITGSERVFAKLLVGED